MDVDLNLIFKYAGLKYYLL